MFFALQTAQAKNQFMRSKNDRTDLSGFPCLDLSGWSRDQSGEDVNAVASWIPVATLTTFCRTRDSRIQGHLTLYWLVRSAIAASRTVLLRPSIYSIGWIATKRMPRQSSSAVARDSKPGLCWFLKWPHNNTIVL